ncbi:darcynin family protein [Thalassotalea fusca]
MKYTIVVKYNFNTTWLKLSRQARKGFEEQHTQPIFAKYAGKLAISFHDAEAFSADFSDFFIVSTTDLQAYYFLMEELRDSALIADEHVEIKEIFIGVEDGYKDFEQANQ